MTSPAAPVVSPSQHHSEGSPSRTSQLSNGTREDADIHASSSEYAARFGGTVGRWMLDVQEGAILDLLDPDYRSILDIGGGHGHVALPLARAHRSVTVLGSAPICAEQLQPQIENGVIAFNSGDLINTPYQASSFDAVYSFRLMSHCTAWRNLIAEMCRVARLAVVIDYPVWFSVNFLAPLTFKIKRRIEGNTRTYRIFSTFEVHREFEKHGFVLERVRKQFFFPMAIHRALKNPQLSMQLEGAARKCGATALFGSPVIAKFVRKESGPSNEGHS